MLLRMTLWAAALAAAIYAPAAAATACEQLTLQGAADTSLEARVVAAGPLAASPTAAVPEFCRVVGTINYRGTSGIVSTATVPAISPRDREIGTRSGTIDSQCRSSLTG